MWFELVSPIRVGGWYPLILWKYEPWIAFMIILSKRKILIFYLLKKMQSMLSLLLISQLAELPDSIHPYTVLKYIVPFIKRILFYLHIFFFTYNIWLGNLFIIYKKAYTYSLSSGKLQRYILKSYIQCLSIWAKMKRLSALQTLK